MSDQGIVVSRPYVALDHRHEELSARGWTVLSADELSDDVVGALEEFGQIIPQFNGQTAFAITRKPGYEDLPYSQSMNGIGPHTEAPVYGPPPRYLALHCHRQARCGGGHTGLVDGYEFLSFLETADPELREWINDTPVEFVATAKPGEPAQTRVKEFILTPTEDADVFRFSYNQFHYGDVNPSKEDLRQSQVASSSSPLARFARLGEAYFVQRNTPVLIPDGCMLIWDNWRMIHARSQYTDPARHLTRYWLA
ncbi:TauD/TfdA family dioxygenase [Pseudomonas sp. N3-W]|jgi:Taurine catabolism dioxygenase TauD, TfdA family|uniref:TauD/TfdA family dioxygenase n=1 Tax=Pseudomonas fungipugnans TaxID=3024217 RepID=A0ABT6QLU1_9PSED|nr:MULTISPECIES: TauD/TfdA family dioxygenase [unclassified Pseudomonas]MDI2591847.1 TauD/TfdA family dioxygenase [Pseudomonas sp. 681]UWF48321.1 TauD/TfdA family dioxygenase [Pseudomonas sp. N3-W]